MTKIKLCGLKRQEDIEWANELNPEYIGFVFAKKSIRLVSHKEAIELRKMLKDSIVAVGVFKDNPLEEVVSCIKSGAITIAQLHGNEDANFCRSLKEKTDCVIIKAFGIAGESDIKRANEFDCDFCLLDTPGGGTGKSFDHSLLYKMERPYFLAGGLDAANVQEAILKYHPYAVDVSTKIETDGVKDYKKMKAFVEAVRERG